MDEALAMRLTIAELKATPKGKSKLPEGLRYAGEADYDDALGRVATPHPELMAA